MDKSAIEVALRIRDCNEGEERVDDNVFIVEEDNNIIHSKNYSYKLDHIFNVGAENESIYNSLVADKISKILGGYNVTILAYGATGSGKTYTMGTDLRTSKPGLIPLALQHIFKSLKTVDSDRVVVKASFFEIYLEEIKDLLKSNSVCSLRGEAADLQIIGLSEKIINCEEEAFKVLETGNLARKTEATAKNRNSSRSHAIFVLTISLMDKKTGTSHKSKFQLVDLAGSERSKTTKTSGETLKQGITINKSLSTLGRVILSIVRKEKHIPYRDSILTRILQDSLGGNSYTVLVACINLVLSSAEENLNTLRYADSAKNIKNTPTINKEEKKNLQELKKEISRLKSELKEIKRNPPLTQSMDYYKINALLENLREYSAVADVKISQLYEKLAILYNLLSGYISEIEEKDTSVPFISDTLKKLECLKNEVQILLEETDSFRNERLTPSSTPNVSLNVTFKVESDEPMNIEEKESFETCPESSKTCPDSSETLNEEDKQECIESTMKLENIEKMICEISPEDISEDFKQQYAETALEIENLEKMIMLKEASFKSCKDLQPIYAVNCNEKSYQALLNKLSVLSEAQSKLLNEKNLLKAEEQAKEKELKEKIRSLEKEISQLQSEIRRSDVLRDLQRKSKEKEENLKKEILNLKQSKVQLLKKQKLELSKLKRQTVEESKKRAVLEKNWRKITVEKEKMKSGFEKKINVLKQKLENIQKQKKSQPSKIKESTESLKTESLLNKILAQVDNILQELVSQEIYRDELERYEEEMNSLVQQLKNIEDKKEKSDIDENLESIEEKNIKTNLEECMNKINEMKNEDKKNAGSGLFDFIAADNAKNVVQHLTQKYVSNEVDWSRKVIGLNSDLQKKDFLVEELENSKQKLNSLVIDLKQEVEDTKRENEKNISSLEREWETKIFLLLESHRKISEKTPEDKPKSPEAKKILNFEKELWIKKNKLFESFNEQQKLKKENKEIREKLAEVEVNSKKIMSDAKIEQLKLKKENKEISEKLVDVEVNSKKIMSDTEIVQLKLKKDIENLKEQLEKSDLKLPEMETELSKLKKENEELKQQLSKTKMKSETKLMPVIKIDTKQEKIETCTDSDMVGAFLTEADESITSVGEVGEKRDPDWRATPVHRRRKTQQKRKIDDDSKGSQEVVPQKKVSAACSCPSDCSSKRCSCRKKKVTCSTNCNCNNGSTCTNQTFIRRFLC